MNRLNRITRYVALPALALAAAATFGTASASADPNIQPIKPKPPIFCIKAPCPGTVNNPTHSNNNNAPCETGVRGDNNGAATPARGTNTPGAAAKNNTANNVAGVGTVDKSNNTANNTVVQQFTSNTTSVEAPPAPAPTVVVQAPAP